MERTLFSALASRIVDMAVQLELPYDPKDASDHREDIFRRIVVSQNASGFTATIERNPDLYNWILESCQAETDTAAMVGLLVRLKGLFLAYNRPQERAA